jgi:hypothetical protein
LRHVKAQLFSRIKSTGANISTSSQPFVTAYWIDRSNPGDDSTGQ